MPIPDFRRLFKFGMPDASITCLKTLKLGMPDADPWYSMALQIWDAGCRDAPKESFGPVSTLEAFSCG